MKNLWNSQSCTPHKEEEKVNRNEKIYLVSKESNLTIQLNEQELTFKNSVAIYHKMSRIELMLETIHTGRIYDRKILQ